MPADYEIDRARQMIRTRLWGTVTGDELKLSNPTPGAGGRSETVLKRVK